MLPAFLPSCASGPLGGMVTLDGQLLSTSLQRVPVLRQGQLLGFGGLKFARTQVLENGRLWNGHLGGGSGLASRLSLASRRASPLSLCYVLQRVLLLRCLPYPAAAASSLAEDRHKSTAQRHSNLD